MEERNIISLTEAIESFSKQLHQKLNKQDDNDLSSPISIHAFLTLLSQDPWFHTKNFFYVPLCINVDDACSLYKDLFATFTHVKDLLIANTTFLNHPGEIWDVFDNFLKNNFASEANLLDFSNRENSAETMNAWVSDRTSQKINPFDFSKDNVNLTFLSTMCFKNVLAEPFPVEETVCAEFHLNNQNTVQVQMMRKKDEFYYGYNAYIQAKVLKLPMADSDVSLVVVLPEEGVNISDFIQDLCYRDVTEFTRNMAKQKVDVSLPKFKINKALDITQYLKEVRYKFIP